MVLEDSGSGNHFGAESEQGSDQEGTLPTDERPPSDDEREEKLIPNPGFQGLGFEAMLRLALLSKMNLWRAGNRETEFWHLTRVGAWYSVGIPGPDSASVVIRTNALQVVYGNHVFKPPALPYSFITKVKKEDIPLVQIQGTTGLLGGVIISMMVALASMKQKLKQTSTELGKTSLWTKSLPRKNWIAQYQYA